MNNGRFLEGLLNPGSGDSICQTEIPIIKADSYLCRDCGEIFTINKAKYSYGSFKGSVRLCPACTSDNIEHTED